MTSQDTPIDLDKVRTVCILGEIDEGKSNLAFYYLNNYQGDREIYLFGYPKKVEGMTLLSTWNDLMAVKDGIIFIDEIQKFVKTYDKKANTQLMELLSFFAHKNNTLIFTTPSGQFITRGVESLIDCWAFKRLDLETLKNGSKAKRVIQRLCYPGKNDIVLDLAKDEYYEFSERNELGENRIKKFDFQGVEKVWR